MNATQADAAGLPAASTSTHQGTRPYAPSWLNRFIDWIERLPGPQWAPYLVVMVLVAGAAHVGLWTSGLVEAGTLDPAQVFWAVFGPALVFAFGHLERVAASAFDAYRPVLELDAVEAARLRYAISVVPARPAAIVLAVLIPLTALLWYVDPVASQVIGYNATALAFRLVAEGLTGAVLVLLVYQAIRQVRLVQSLHAMPDRVDIFQPRPLYAFSRLTGRIGLVLVAAIASSTLVVPPVLESTAFWVVWAPWIIGPPLLAVAVFVIPLVGMHGRLAREKEHIQAESDTRLKAVLAELNAATDARDIARAEGLQKLLAAQVAQRDLLAKLHTWPWNAGTLGAFLPALALPVVVFVIQRLLADLLTI